MVKKMAPLAPEDLKGGPHERPIAAQIIAIKDKKLGKFAFHYFPAKKNYRFILFHLQTPNPQDEQFAS